MEQAPFTNTDGDKVQMVGDMYSFKKRGYRKRIPLDQSHMAKVHPTMAMVCERCKKCYRKTGERLHQKVCAGSMIKRLQKDILDET
jgi:hypothetical protein